MTDFASMAIHLRWISVCVYFSVVILVTLLICGIQWVRMRVSRGYKSFLRLISMKNTMKVCLTFKSQPWLIFIWSIMMIVMLLLDGIVTVLTIRHDDQQVRLFHDEFDIR